MVFYLLKNVDIIKYINWPKSKILKTNNCKYIFKSGKKKHSYVIKIVYILLSST